MQDTFQNLGVGLILASLLIYFLMVALFKSYITPLVVLAAVPIGIVGVIIMLYLTGRPREGTVCGKESNPLIRAENTCRAPFGTTGLNDLHRFHRVAPKQECSAMLFQLATRAC